MQGRTLRTVLFEVELSHHWNLAVAWHVLDLGLSDDFVPHAGIRIVSYCCLGSC